MPGSRKRISAKPERYRRSKNSKRKTATNKSAAVRLAERHVDAEDTGISPLELLALASAIYRSLGTWTASAEATVDRIPTWRTIYDISTDAEAYRAFALETPGFSLSREDELEAQRIRSWALAGVDDPVQSAIASTLVTDDVAGRAFAIACSAIPAFHGIIPKQKTASSKHVGVIGERTILDLTLTRITKCSTRRPSYRLGFADGVGNVVVWFSSRSPRSLALELQDRRELRATIRKHTEYGGTAQTIVTRAVVVA